MTKSIVFAYLFALIGGIFGLHHLYLGRTQQAFLWLTTFGGFGLGILYDLFFAMQNYVLEANQDANVAQRYREKSQQLKSPAFELRRFCAQYVVGLFYGFITFYAFPDTWSNSKFLSLIVGIATAFAVALGIQLMGTLGPRKCSFVWPLIGALLGLPFLVGRAESSPSLNIVAFLSSWIFEWKIDWNVDEICPKTPKTKSRRHFVKRCLIFSAGAILFASILSMSIYQNLHVDINGERVKVKDVLSNFFQSQEYLQLCQQLSSVMKQLWAFYLQYGFKGIWTQIWTALDFESDKKAFETLNLKSDASQKQIESQCRTLSRKWHPDRYRDPEEKQKAQTTFMNIQQACDRLSQDRKRRQTINTQKRENPT